MQQANFFDRTYSSWSEEASRLIYSHTPPQDIAWDGGGIRLLKPEMPKAAPSLVPMPVPEEFVKVAEYIACARDDDRWSLLYRLLFRLQYDNPDVMEDKNDSDVKKAMRLYHSVRIDMLKMNAFVRFKNIIGDGEKLPMAWYQPNHFVTSLSFPALLQRYSDHPWVLFTPDESAYWDMKTLHIGAGVDHMVFADRDELDPQWLAHFHIVFPNIASPNARSRRLPVELGEIPKEFEWNDLRRLARACTACPLHLSARQTVFGDGPLNAEMMIVGEQPGQQEDLIGRPFVGPAGSVLDGALVHAQIRRADLYITSAVKHFKWKSQGNIRFHQRPSVREVHTCRRWLDAEIERVRPKVIVALGATAAATILNRKVKISSERGKPVTTLDHKTAEVVIVSWHPAAILRTPDPFERQKRMRELCADLALARAHTSAAQ